MEVIEKERLLTEELKKTQQNAERSAHEPSILTFGNLESREKLLIKTKDTERSGRQRQTPHTFVH